MTAPTVSRSPGVDTVILAFAPIAGHHIIEWLVIGLVAGALAGRIVEGHGFGIVHDIIVGIAGAVLAGFILHVATGQGHASPSFFVELLIALLGAVVLVFVVRAAERLGGHGRSRRRKLL
jgi:uncharacterized membrane protein YeaQ/YmgE (transglycosylase-associated protein family)